MYKFRDFEISDHMGAAINRYVNEKLEPGGFLTAVICNDLSGAVAQADDNNLKNIPAFVAYFYNETPSSCWGSKEKMDNWLDKDMVQETLRRR